MMSKNSFENFDFLKLWDEISKIPDKFEKSKQLSSLALIQKTAVTKINNKKSFSLPEGKIRLEYDKFIKTACSNQLDSLLFEYVKIAQQKTQSLPLNLIVSLIVYAHKNHELAPAILDSLSDSGKYVLGLKKEWDYLNVEKPFIITNSNKENGVSFYIHFKNNPEKLFQHLADKINEWNEKSVLLILDSISPIANLIPNEKWIEIYSKSKGKLKYKLISILLSLKINPLYDEVKNKIDLLLDSTKIDFNSKNHSILEFQKLDLLKTFEYIPTSIYSDEKYFKNLILQINEIEKLELLVDVITQFKDIRSAHLVLKTLIDQGELSEKISVRKITTALDHKSFNEIAIHFIRTMKDKIDLEAFLHLIDYHTHYWYDELLLEVLQLHRHKALVKKYDLDVFYNFIPYRINPHSQLENEIPQSIKENINDPLTYNSILQFRKLLRK